MQVVYWWCNTASLRLDHIRSKWMKRSRIAIRIEEWSERKTNVWFDGTQYTNSTPFRFSEPFPKVCLLNVWLAITIHSERPKANKSVYQLTGGTAGHVRPEVEEREWRREERENQHGCQAHQEDFWGRVWEPQAHVLHHSECGSRAIRARARLRTSGRILQIFKQSEHSTFQASIINITASLFDDKSNVSIFRDRWRWKQICGTWQLFLLVEKTSVVLFRLIRSYFARMNRRWKIEF